MTELEDKLLKAIEKFENKIQEKPDYREELEDWTKTVLIDAGEEKYHFTIDNAVIKDFGHGSSDSADIFVLADNSVLVDILDGTLNPMKAYAKKQIKIKASFSDLLKIRKFF